MHPIADKFARDLRRPRLRVCAKFCLAQINPSVTPVIFAFSSLWKLSGPTLLP